MAKRTSRSARAVPARATKTKIRKTPDVEVAVAVDEGPGMGVDAALGLTTSILLVLAILFTDKLLAKFGSGLFF